MTAPVRLRRATADDVEAVAEIWETGWHDGHDGHVPAELSAVRTAESFRSRTADRVAQTAVALLDGEVVGFVVTHDDEIEQVFVTRSARGSGVAQALMAEGLGCIAAAGHKQAWLVAAAGNARARRFYEREGWVDEGVVDYAAEGPDGPILVPNHRYVRSWGAPALG